MLPARSDWTVRRRKAFARSGFQHRIASRVSTIESRVWAFSGGESKVQSEFGVAAIGPDERYPDDNAFAGQSCYPGARGVLGL